MTFDPTEIIALYVQCIQLALPFTIVFGCAILLYVLFLRLLSAVGSISSLGGKLWI